VRRRSIHSRLRGCKVEDHDYYNENTILKHLAAIQGVQGAHSQYQGTLKSSLISSIGSGSDRSRGNRAAENEKNLEKGKGT